MEVNGHTIELGAKMTVVKRKMVMQTLVVALVFLAGCHS